jgi:cobalt-zinc-cadmium efflux system protein
MKTGHETSAGGGLRKMGSFLTGRQASEGPGHSHSHNHAHKHTHGDGHEAAHGHSHSPRHTPDQGSRRNRQGLLTAFLLNFSFTLIEIVGGLYTQSFAILSDALHDLGDSLGLIFAYLAERYAHKQPTSSNYTFGYKRLPILGALLNGLVLLGGSIAVLSMTIPRLWSPNQPDAQGMLWLAVLGLVANGLAALRLGRNSSLNSRAVMLHLLEDVLGWAAVLVVAIVLQFYYLPILDTLLALAINAFVLYNAVKLLRQVADILLQRAPHPIDIAKLRQRVEECYPGSAVKDLHFWTVDGTDHHLSMHLQVPEAADAAILMQRKQQLRQEIQQQMPHAHITLELEFPGEPCPDHCEPPAVDAQVPVAKAP